jgi:hypothetical protein
MCPPNTLQIFSECLMMGVGQPANLFCHLLLFPPIFHIYPNQFKKHRLLFPYFIYLLNYLFIELFYFWHDSPPFYLIRTLSAQNLTPLISPILHIYPIGSNFVTSQFPNFLDPILHIIQSG